MNATWGDILEWPRVSSHKHTCMHTLNPSTSAKSVMTKLQNLFVALVNIDTFR